jgi:hypothetical protein
VGVVNLDACGACQDPFPLASNDTLQRNVMDNALRSLLIKYPHERFACCVCSYKDDVKDEAAVH